MKIIKRWKQHGFLIVNRKRDGKRELLNREQISWLTDAQTLEEMSHLSLRKRAMLVQERLQLQSFSYRTLRHYYHRYGIKYKRPDYSYWKSRAENQDLLWTQYNYVREMVDYMQKGVYNEIIYIDETTFNLWQRVSKCWLKPGMKLSMLKFRGPSITVIGAISKERGLIHYELFDDSKNADRFGHFLIGLKNKCKWSGRVAVVQDNLRIHHANAIQNIYDNLFHKIMLPTYSCALNPIETFWSLLKRRWRQNIFHVTEYLAQQQQQGIRNKSI